MGPDCDRLLRPRPLLLAGARLVGRLLGATLRLYTLLQQIN
jgi:hypothetical protein